MSRGNRALTLAALALSLAPLALTGCGMVDDARWARMPAGYLPMTEESLPAAMTQAMFSHDTAHMEMTAGEESMSMDVRFGEGEEPAMTGTYRDGESVATMVVLDGKVYVREEGDPTYFQFPDQLADQVLAEMEMSNPKEMAADLRSGIESVQYGGAHEVEYGPAHRYDVTMREEFIAEELGVPAGSVPDFSYRMWFDDDNLLRRFSVITDEGTAADVTFSEWGEPVEIEAPPPGRVEPLPMPSDEA